MKSMVKRFYRRICPWAGTGTKIWSNYQKSVFFNEKNIKILSGYYCYKNEKKYHCRISPKATIKGFLSMPHPDGVIIGEGSKIGKNVRIYQQVTIGQNCGKYPTIDDNVIIYAGAKIIGGIRIGRNSIIGANSVVTKDIPENSIAVGIPAKVIKENIKNAGDYY